MEGTSIAQAKQALLMALDRLTPDDAFNIVQFNSVTDVLFNSSVTASAANIAKARDYVKALRATGGTEMAPALTAALNNSDNQRVLRQVIFLTDGAVGNEAQLFELIKARLGDSRLFTVGIGSAPNTYFMSKAAQLGRGTYTYIGKVDEVKEKMTRLFTKLESPVVSNLRVTWPADAEAEMWPRQIPDLYLGEPLFVTAKLRKLAGTVLLEGQIGAETWRAEVSTQLASAESGINVLWARDEIESLSDAMRGSKGEDNKQAITDLALHHHLVSKYTSMVAVDVTKTLPNDALTQTSAMPTNLPEGWNYEAVFGTLPQTATSAREQLLLGLLLLAIATLWLLRRPART
jgi:Ca-activated chloride channel family protein